MSTSKDTILFILNKLRNAPRFSTRAMFGEYVLYADNKVVALVCDDMMFVKICPASFALEAICEKDSPYEGAKLHYVISEEQFDTISNLSDILFKISASLPVKKRQNNKMKYSKI